MKKTVLPLLLGALTFFACKKECPDQRPDLKGLWIGKWAENFETPQNLYRLQIKNDSEVEVNNGFANYVGTWKVEDYTFVASYIIDGQTLTLKAPINKARMEGTWRNVKTGLYKGTFYLDRQ